MSLLNWHDASNAALRAEFRALCALWSVREVAEFAPAGSEDIAERWERDKRIFSIVEEGRRHYPSFQFDNRSGQPYPELREIVTLLEADYAGWSLAIWFLTANDWLDGQSPIAVWTSQRDRIVRAARNEFEVFHAPTGAATGRSAERT